MKRTIFAWLIAIAALAFPAHASAETPTAFLKSVDGDLKPLLANTAANKDKILKLVNRMLDFDTLCKSSLGRHWEGKSEAQHKEFCDTLHALIEKNVVERLKDTRKHKITYESEEIVGSEATVVTVVANGDGPRASRIEIAYKLAQSGGSWKVIDMTTDGVSLVSNYRSQFNKIITQDGFDAVIKKMKDKLAEKSKTSP